ncbi:leucine-rich repeat-containing [Podarcis lilfordi]|uniref:Leucine-rich repeat-containing n=1 Tax=Podarcis lilfordi TaxID=74358 RepID=A0AA35L2Y5_9SAUR|nr:leucine-rich repeat-containing [Podarcis lilfordi]
MLARQLHWAFCCWLGVCLWLLAGERGCIGAAHCRSPPCSRSSDSEHQPSRQHCQGPHCSGRARHPSRAFAHSTTPVQGQLQQPLGGSSLGHAALAATRGAEESCSGGGDCSPGAPNGTVRDCKGIECRLPLHIRQKSRPATQTIPCPPKQGEGCQEPTLVRATERAAQFIGEDLAYTASELGGAALGVQLTCDVKPGGNEVPSEDALVLQLQLTKGQEKFVDLLKSQQAVIVDLQQKLAEQQSMLVAQQREIVEQHRKMYEQMDLIKVQYGMLFDTVKQMSFQSLQEDIQHYFEANLQGLQNQVRSHLQKSYSMHKVEVDAKVIDVGEPLMDCGLCESDEFCNFQKTPSQCEKCTLCPAGFFQLSECSTNADRICQDRDECIESPNICGERIKCLNTPGGFRCLGIAAKEAALGLCGEEYFFNKELQECQACLMCEDRAVVLPCSTVSDTVCSTASENKLSESWTANVILPMANSGASQIYPGVTLKIKGKYEWDIITVEENSLVFKQHGLMWADFNFAVKHNCRNFLQLALKVSSQEEEGCELSAVRIEQPEGKIFQSVSVSGTAEVEPGQALWLFLKSPNQFCNQSKDFNVYDLNTPLSLLWLSHDTGAVAMTAQLSTAMHYQTNYRPTFRLVSLSDPYMLTLSHDGRAVKFTERGVVKFVLHQALYSMGPTCIREGLSLVSYLNRNGTNAELMTVHKSGVNYRDTSISASGATKVEAGDLISFEILSPAQCNIRYFGDSSGISTLSLIWIPSAVSTALTASVSVKGLPTGAVRNKLLDFTQVSSIEKQIRLVSTGQLAQKYFVFTERGVASVVFSIKLIHSCNMLRVTLNQLLGDHGQPHSIAQQVGGQMPEGSIWTSVALRSSFEVHNGTMISVSLDCVRGRVNHVAHQHGTGLSILWVSSIPGGN